MNNICRIKNCGQLANPRGLCNDCEQELKFMGKRGMELSMNVIIICAIGLLVLVILAVLVIDNFNPPVVNNSTNLSQDIYVNYSKPNDVMNLSDWGISNNITNAVEPTFGVIVNDTPIFSMDGNASKFILDEDAWVESNCTSDVLAHLNPDVNHTKCFVRRLI